MNAGRPDRGRWSIGEATGLGLFAAVQTFVFFALRDRFSVLLWWSRESWLYVALLWAKDLALAAAAFFVFSRLAKSTIALPEAVDPEDRASRRRHALLFAAILALGIALRWIAPRQIPPGVWADALFEAEGALRDPGHIPWFGGRPLQIEGLRNSALVSNLYLHFCALIFRIFGRGDTGILALSAVGGSLSLPAVYWLGREIGSRRRAIVAMAILAFSGWPLVFSRWAWTATLLLPLALAGAAAAVRARRTRSLVMGAMAGLFVGLSLHTHPAAWAAAAAFLAFAATRFREPGVKRLVAAAALAGFLAFLPFGAAFLEYPERLGGRAQDVSFLAPTKDVAVPGGNRAWAPPLRLLYNAIEYTGLFLWTTDPNPRHGLPDRSPMNPALGVAALLGAALALRKARSGGAGERLVLFLAGTSLLAGILGNPGGAPNGLRVYPFVGVVVLWAAESLDRWIPATAGRLSARPSIVWTLAASVLFVLETVPFLTRWPEARLVAGSFCAAETASGRVRRDLGQAPTFLDPTALSWPIVFETLSADSDPERPVPRIPRMTPADLASRRSEAAWYVTTPRSLEKLRSVGWRCSRGISPGDDLRDVVISRVGPGKSAVPVSSNE